MNEEENLLDFEEIVEETATSEDENINQFATIGAVYSDGVSLIFDSQTEATEKHYKVNTSIDFQAGDRVRVLKDSGTYIVEYIVGAPKADYPHPIPSGGSAGQYLKKNSATSYDVVWASVSSSGVQDLKVVTFSRAVAPAASSSVSSAFYTSQQSGWTPVGIVAFYCNNSNCIANAYASSISSTLVYISYTVRNFATSKSSGTLYIDVLYKQ